MATGGVRPFFDPDGSIDDENSQGSPQDGAAVVGRSKGCTAVAERSTGCTLKPSKPKMNFYKLRWDFVGAWEAHILRGPRKATKVTCRVTTMKAYKWARISGVHNYKVDFNNATYNETKLVAMHFMELHMQDVQCEMLAQ